MEQQDPNVIRFMDWLDSTMEVLDEKIQTGTVKSNADYLSFFEDKAEELYRQHYMYKCLNDLRSHVRKLETPRQIQEYIQRRRNACLDKLLEQDIRKSRRYIRKKKASWLMFGVSICLLIATIAAILIFVMMETNYIL